MPDKNNRGIKALSQGNYYQADFRELYNKMQQIQEHGSILSETQSENVEDKVIKNKSRRFPRKQFQKAPQAPKRFKSSYICFFMENQGKTKAELGPCATVSDVSKRTAELWRKLTDQERAHWNKVAARDKERFLFEQSSYTGPWRVPNKRAKKDPSAPKRPMS